MANPNLLANTSSVLELLAEGQLAAGDNNYTVPASTSWLIKSMTLCNVSGSSVTVNISVIRSGAARKVVHNLALASGDTAVTGTELVAVLPEAATLRVNSSASAAVDIVVSGVVSS